MTDSSIVAPTQRARLPLWMVLFAVAIVAGSALFAAGEPLAGALVIVTPLLPFVYYALFRAISGDQHFGPLLATAIFFILCSNFRYRDVVEKTIDWQVALQLLAICGTLGVSALFFRQIIRRFNLHVFACWLSLYVVLLCSSFYALSPLYAGVSTISLIGSFLYLCYLCIQYGRDRMVEILVWAGLLMCAGSIAAYFAIPEFGRMKNWFGDDLLLTSRMQGLFGSSNGTGIAAATLLLLTILFYMRQPGASRFIGWATIVTAFVCLLLSINRMAVGAFLLSLLVYFLVTGRFGQRLLLLLSLAVLAVVPVLLFPDAVFELVSRTGNAEEISSGTGRTRIWAVVLELIPRSWLIGYGYASAQSILPFRPDLFDAAVHTHNLYLEVLFSSGVIGLVVLMWCILATIILAVRVGGARELSFFVFFLPYGLTEPVIGGVTDFGIIMWQASVVLLFYRAKLLEFAAARVASPPTQGHGA